MEIVTVSQDTDQDALAKFVKETRYARPVLFDGQGNKGDFCAKLNAQPARFGAFQPARHVHRDGHPGQ